MDTGTPDQTPPRHRTLLGHLAWRSKLDEPFATDALAVLLQHPDIRVRFLRDLQERYRERGLEVDLTRVSRIDPRADHRDFGTPDLVGFDTASRPILVIEAKFDDELGHRQVKKYMEVQRRDVNGLPCGLLLLVPSYKVDSALATGRAVAQQLGLDESIVMALSWQDVLDVVEAAADTLGQGARSYAADTAQLRDFVDERTRFRLLVLTEALSDANWEENVEALVKLAKEASKRVAGTRGASLEGTAHLDIYGYGPARYVLEDDGIFWTLGPHKAFASRGDGPLWLRFSSGTGKSPQAVVTIRSRLVSEGKWKLRDDLGDLWVGVEVDETWDEVSRQGVLDLVVSQVLEVLEAGLPPTAGQREEPDAL